MAVCVDDYGLHAGVDAAVQDLGRRGRITAVSCMVGGPGWAQAAPALRELGERLDIGLHLDFTAHPVDPTLKGGLASWMVRSAARRVPRDAVRREIEVQLDRFEAALGRAPDHVDGHQHLHHFPVFRELLVDALARRYAGALPWLRRTQHIPGTPFAAKSAVIDAMGCGPLSKLARQKGFPQNARMLGVYDFRGGAGRFATLLDTWLGAAAHADLLMCHPAVHAPGAEVDGMLEARVAEHAVMGGDAFAETLSRRGLTLARMSALLRSA